MSEALDRWCAAVCVYVRACVYEVANALVLVAGTVAELWW